jgi:hypothetical protein
MAAGGYALQYGKNLLAADGMFLNYCTGDHNQNGDNGVRGFNPWSTSKTDATGASRAGLTGWHRKATNIGVDVTQYDNRAHWHIPSDRILITPAQGVFNYAAGNWIRGGLSPQTQAAETYFSMDATDIASGFWTGSNTLYNPVGEYVEALDCVFIAGGAPSGDASSGGYNKMWKLRRKVAGDSFSEPWRLDRYDVPAGMSQMQSGTERNCACAVGPYIYFRTSSLQFWRVDVSTMTSPPTAPTAVRLADVPNVSSDYYSQFMYDERRKRILFAGQQLWVYDIDTDAWSNITPGNWVAMAGLFGAYHRDQDAAFFRGGWHGDANNNLFDLTPENYHKITFEVPASGNRFRRIIVNSAANPFRGPPDTGYGGTKHVNLCWHPVKKRMYTYGGDYGVGAGNFGQTDMGSNFTTNAPSGANTYARDSSLCNDQYSIDPLASGTQDWRLEHPYLPRNLSGTREERPGRPDQCSMVWDPVRNKFWMFYHVLRTEFLYRQAGVPDLWANGSILTSPEEPDATWSWVPGTSGSPGTFTKESTTKVLVYRAGATSYSGSKLISGYGDERIGGWQYHAPSDKIFCLSAAVGSTVALFIFDPATLDYEYRTVNISGYSRMDCSMSHQAIVDDWLYAVALSTTSGGTRGSKLIRVNLTAALAAANEAALASGDFVAVDLPWSLSPGSAWESSGDASAKWQEHAGVCAVDRKVVVIKSYDGLIEDGATKLATWCVDARRWVALDTAPENIHASSWVTIPDTGEILIGLTTGNYSNDQMWAYRAR